MIFKICYCYTALLIHQYTITNVKGSLTVKVIEYGAIITNILVPDKNGNIKDVVLGFDNYEGYLGKVVKSPYFGALIGRFANRYVNKTKTNINYIKLSLVYKTLYSLS